MECITAAIGICHSESGLPSARLIDLEVLRSEIRSQCSPSVATCLSSALSAATRVLTLGETTASGVLSIRASVPLELMEGPSYGLAIFVSLAGLLLRTGTREEIAYTGAITPEGTVESVGDLELKLAVSCDKDRLVIPDSSDVGGRISADGPRILKVKSVHEVLWLGLTTSYLTDHLLPSSSTPWETLSHYIDKHVSIGLLPKDIGFQCRSAYARGSVLTELVDSHRLEYGAKLISLCPFSDPDPTNLLQAIFCEYDWAALQQDEHVKAESVIGGYVRALAEAGLVVESRDLLNLYFLATNSRKVLARSGPIRNAIMEIHNELQKKKDVRGLSMLFGGPSGISRRIAAADISDTDLQIAVSNPPTVTEVVHDKVGSTIRLGRFRYFFRGEQLGFEIEDPMALLDSSSTVPDNFRRDHWTIAMDSLLSSEKGRIVAENFSPQAIRLNRFDVNLLWQDGLGCWPPSIDALHMLSDIYNGGSQFVASDSKSILDLCCGCGVIGLALAKIGNFNSVSFMDIEPTACALTRINIAENFAIDGTWSSSADVGLGYELSECIASAPDFAPMQFRVYRGEATSLLLKLRAAMPPAHSYFDRVFFTPPYIPEPDLLHIPLWRATSGTGLLEWVVENGHLFTSQLVVSYSEIVEPIVSRALAKCPKVSGSTLLGDHWVAFRIPGFVDAFRLVDDCTGRRSMTEEAKDYWRLYLECLEETSCLEKDQLVPSGGHGFKWAHRIVTRSVLYDS